jgi:hypothetical protein
MVFPPMENIQCADLPLRLLRTGFFVEDSSSLALRRRRYVIVVLSFCSWMFYSMALCRLKPTCSTPVGME